MERARAVTTCAALLLFLAVGGCSLLSQNYRCEPAPGPDRPDAREPDRIGGVAAADSTPHLPCEQRE